MNAPFSRRAVHLALPLFVVVAAGPAPGAGTAPPPRTGFSGSWALTEQTIHDPAAGTGKTASGPDAGSETTVGGRGGRKGSGAPATGMDDPLEALGDAHRLVIVDDGRRLEITYPSGRRRTFVTDDEERELDDGDGPAKVVAKRRSSPERVVITSKWLAGHGLKETWELSPGPRRLVVSGKVGGRHDFSYRRVYEPARDLSPTPTTPPTPTLVAAPPSEPPPAPAVRPECSLRPPDGASPSELARLAKIPLEEAQRRAVASAAPHRVTSVISSDPEVNEGCLVWPLDLRIEGKSGVLEVLIDAGDGKVLSSTFESSN
jgi:hypothetical protein